MKGLLTVRQAAGRLEVTRQSLYYAIENGLIKAQEIGGVKFISETVLAGYEPDRARQQRMKTIAMINGGKSRG